MGRPTLDGLPQAPEIAEVAQNSMRLFRDFTERQILVRNIDAQILQRSQDIAITFASNPQAMQLLAR